MSLQELFQRQQGIDKAAAAYGAMSLSMHSTPAHYGSTMTMAGGSSSHFATINPKSHSTTPAKSGRVYASVAEMKRKGKVRTGRLVAIAFCFGKIEASSRVVFFFSLENSE